MTKHMKTVLAGLALFVTTSVLCADNVEIRLKTGATWRGDSADVVQINFLNNGVPIELRGKFERIEDLYVVVRETGGSKRQWTIFRADITALQSVEATSDDADADTSTTADASTDDAAKPAPKRADAYSDKTPGVIILPLNGGVGETLRQDEIRAIAEEADKYGPGQIVVLDIYSPGGSVFEMQDIHDTILEIKKRHRVVAWIRSAISAAAATAINCDEIYFRTDGDLGAITAHAGGRAIPEEQQEMNRQNLRRMMALGGRPEFIVDAMVFAHAELSYDRDPITGEVTWHPDTSGEFVLSDSKSNLVLTSSQAIHSKFADGIADTKEELGELLGLPKWHEKSQYGYELAEDIDKLFKRGSEEIPLLMARMNYAGSGSGTLAFLQKRIQTLQQLSRWWDLHKNLCYDYGLAPKEDLQRLIDATRKEIARLRG